MIDTTRELGAIHREVSQRQTDDGEVVRVLLQRSYDAPMPDVWDALTDPDRIKRWFMPVTGDLREGGDFQLEGNASGDPVAAANSPEVQEFSRQSVHAWVAVTEATGAATGDEIAAAREVALAQFAPDLQPDQGAGN